MAVPTWSWMAYEGSIDFLELPLGEVEWKSYKIYSPWTQNASEVYRTSDQAGSIELSAVARRFSIQGARANEFFIVYDIPKTEGQQLMCVIMGRRIEKGETEDARHYVLFISPKGAAATYYERVGVGFMPGRLIERDATGPSRFVKIR